MDSFIEEFSDLGFWDQLVFVAFCVLVYLFITFLIGNAAGRIVGYYLKAKGTIMRDALMEWHNKDSRKDQDE